MTTAPTPPLVFSRDRVWRLRIVVGVAGGLGLLLLLLGLPTGAVAIAAGAVVLAAAVGAFVLLPVRDRRARVVTVLCGLLAVAGGLLFGSEAIGILLVVVGIVVLILALVGDDPDSTEGHA